MTGSNASASTEPTPSRASAPPARVLLCGVNWIGDTVMAMPAVQLYRRLHPAAHLAVLVKPALAPLWKLHAAPDEVLTFEPGLAGLRAAAARLRQGRFDRAFVLPHSFRSALLPAWAGVRERVGLPGHARDFMLTRVVPPRLRPGREHQAWEYVDLLTPAWDGDRLPPPELALDRAIQEGVRRFLKPSFCALVGLIPGAARGPSKCWPAARYAEVGRRLAMEQGCSIMVFGSKAEAGLCREVAESIGSGACSVAGQTDLAQWAALLKRCAVVVANDSGGMHLAAAVGTPVVALYGITDPSKTGPLGAEARVLQESELRARDIKPDDPRAARALAALEPDRVVGQVLELLHRKPASAPTRDG